LDFLLGTDNSTKDLITFQVLARNTFVSPSANATAAILGLKVDFAIFVNENVALISSVIFLPYMNKHGTTPNKMPFSASFEGINDPHNKFRWGKSWPTGGKWVRM
jgi:hypothetical protein